MTNFDPIPSIERLGYTPREAAFLYLVARNSGYFLTRQFNWFLRRKAGALTQGFTDKLRAQEHAAVLDYGQSRFVYHLRAKTIYRLLGIENSQNRRVKGDHEIRLRLMILDYLLDRLDTRFLSTEPEKVEFFTALHGITTADLPFLRFEPKGGEASPTDRRFAERFPIGVTNDSIHFAYFDEGAFTTKPFVAFLNRYQSLIPKLKSVVLFYVALNGNNFAPAERNFHRVFPAATDEPSHPLLPHGPEHLVRYFRAQQLFEQNNSAFRHEDLLLLREGERVYRSEEHKKLRHIWLHGAKEFGQAIDRLAPISEANVLFKTCVLNQSYPVFGYRHSGAWLRNLDSVLGSRADSI